MVVAIALRGRGNEVLIGRGAIRLRIERGNGEANRIEVWPGNHVAGEGRLREGIDSRNGAVREIAGAFPSGGDVGDARQPLAHPAAFVIGEEEGGIAAQRTARRGAELVALVGRAGLARGGEEVARVHRAVAQELVGRAVELVAAAFEQYVGLTAA